MVRGPVVRVEEKCCSLGDMLVNSFLLGDGTDMIRCTLVVWSGSCRRGPDLAPLNPCLNENLAGSSKEQQIEKVIRSPVCQ